MVNEEEFWRFIVLFNVKNLSRGLSHNYTNNSFSAKV
jgi:hypothetical protein